MARLDVLQSLELHPLDREGAGGVSCNASPLGSSLQRECLSCATCPLSLLPVGQTHPEQGGSLLLALLCPWDREDAILDAEGCCSVDTILVLGDERHWE